MDVKAAAVAGGAGVFIPFNAAGITEFGDALGLRRADAGSADIVFKEAAGGEGRIADLFGLQTEARLAGEEGVFGILDGEIGRASDDWR